MNLAYTSLLTSCYNELSNCKSQIINLSMQFHDIFNTLGQSNHSHAKHGKIHSQFSFLFGTISSAEETNAIKNNMEILKGNQDILDNQIRQTFNFINLTYAKTNTNRLLLHCLQRDNVHINTAVHHLSKEVKH